MAPLVSGVSFNRGFGRRRGGVDARFIFQISPSISGKTIWNLSSDGSLIFDGGTSTSYTLIPQKTFSANVKMWGEGAAANGGYSYGTINFTEGNTYTAKLNAGRGNAGTGYGWCGPGSPGGGYAGLFITETITQGNAMMIAGGSGGSGGAGCNNSGASGGGTSGSPGCNSGNSEIGSSGGGGGSQSSAGGGGGGGGSSGSALQGGSGGTGATSGYSNAGGGGGGGGGYYGGGGGGGGNDFGGGTRDSSGGGGGSGYINSSYVTGGSTGSYQDAPNRGSAGSAGYGPARVVIESI